MTELTEAQKIVLDKAKKEYDIKFKTWAIDRVLEMTKSDKFNGFVNASVVVQEADVLCDWIMKSPKEWPIPTEDEAASMVEQMKATGEI